MLNFFYKRGGGRCPLEQLNKFFATPRLTFCRCFFVVAGFAQGLQVAWIITATCCNVHNVVAEERTANLPTALAGVQIP